MPEKSPRVLFVSANPDTEPHPVYPIGIAYLAGRLEEEIPDAQIRTFDVCVDSNDRYGELLKVFRPHFVGVSLRNVDNTNLLKPNGYLEACREVITQTRRHCDASIVLGGAGYSIFPTVLFEELEPDYGIVGEGEESFCELIRALESDSDVSTVGGLVHRREGGVVNNPRRPLIREPRPKMHGRLADHYWKHGGMLNVQSKRGCPHSCIYCTYPLIEGRRVRTFDPHAVMETMVELSRTRGIDYFFFSDSVFNLSRKHNVELAENILRSGTKVRWGAYFSPRGLDESLLALLKRSGLTHIEFGTESLSDRTLKSYGKPFRVDDVVSASALCQKLGIDHVHFLILGGYGETRETLEETFTNSTRFGRTAFFPFVGMRVYPGTRLYELAVLEGRIAPGDTLMQPYFYLAKGLDLDALKTRAGQTGKRWVWPDEDHSRVMRRLRLKRDKKGPLWEYLLGP